MIDVKQSIKEKFVQDLSVFVNISLDNTYENENKEWCKTQIVIIPCKSESDALKTEMKIALNYGLFGS